MACEMMMCSCSLCPYSDSTNCPHYKEYEESQKKVYAYVVNRKSGTYTTIASNKNCEVVVGKLKEFFKKEKNIRPAYIKNNLIEITISDGYCNWYSALYLVYNVETNKFHQHYPYSDIVNDEEWNGKVIFSQNNDI